MSFRPLRRRTRKQPPVDDLIFCIGEDFGHYGNEYVINVMECPVCKGTYECVRSVYRYCPHCGVRFEI